MFEVFWGIWLFLAVFGVVLGLVRLTRFVVVRSFRLARRAYSAVSARRDGRMPDVLDPPTAKLDMP